MIPCVYEHLLHIAEQNEITLNLSRYVKYSRSSKSTANSEEITNEIKWFQCAILQRIPYMLNSMIIWSQHMLMLHLWNVN